MYTQLYNKNCRIISSGIIGNAELLQKLSLEKAIEEKNEKSIKIISYGNCNFSCSYNVIIC